MTGAVRQLAMKEMPHLQIGPEHRRWSDQCGVHIRGDGELG